MPRLVSDPSSPQDRAAFLRSRIAILLREPAVARRVGRGLARAAELQEAALAGTPPCFRAHTAAVASTPVRVQGGRCQPLCRSIDCLCGRFPRHLTELEIANGRRLELLAV